MCKPDMRKRDEDVYPAKEPFGDWKAQMARLASFSNMYVKISGGFSEMDPLGPETELWNWEAPTNGYSLQETREWVGHWLNEMLYIFGPRRMIFGSDWPVCNVGGGGNKFSWINWWSVVVEYMNVEDESGFWSGNATRAYSLICPPTTL